MTNEAEYYIITMRHKPEDYYEFWRSDNNGYTFDIKQAGLYSRKSHMFEVMNKKNRNELLKSYTDFFIHKDNLDLIGKKAEVLLK